MRLTVGDGHGGTGTQQRIVTVVNAPPTASFTGACAAHTCTFNASGSADIDGMITSYGWNFGDGATGSGVTASHTYALAGTYSIVLTVVDNARASTTYTTEITVVSPALHVGDLDRTSISQKNTWTATVTIAVHSGSHAAVSNATVFGQWNDGSTATCITNASGQCAVSRFGIAKKVQGASFSVTNVALASFVYEPKDNHDADGDSNATTISVIRP